MKGNVLQQVREVWRQQCPI